jgi:hypothetical protein
MTSSIDINMEDSKDGSNHNLTKWTVHGIRLLWLLAIANAPFQSKYDCNPELPRVLTPFDNVFSTGFIPSIE